MKNLFYCGLTACSLFLRWSAAEAQGFTLDPTFGSGGKLLTNISTPPTLTDAFLDMEVQAANKLLVLAKGSSGLVKIMYKADGSLDTSYGTAGRLALASLPTGFTPTGAGVSGAAGGDGTLRSAYDLRADGTVVLGGTVAASASTYLVLYKADGTLDTSFGTGGSLALGTNVSDYAVLPSGKVVVASSTDVTTQVGVTTGGK